MKVAIDSIVNLWYPHGGISKYFRELQRRLPGFGFDVQVIDYKTSSDVLDSVVSSGPTADDRYCHTVAIPRIFERYREFALNVRDSEIFHSSYYRLPKKFDGVVVTTVHDFIYERFSSGPRKWIHSFQKRRAVMGSNGIICVSRATYSDLLRFIPEARKIPCEIIHNGIDASPLSSENMTEYCGERPFALFVGGRTGYKNFQLAVEACAELAELQLFVVGGGPLTSSQYSLLELRLRGRYQYLGYVADDELKRLYKAAYCLVYTSSFEGFGIPVLEAMAQGCPVVCLRIPSIEEIAGGAVLFCSEPTTQAVVARLRHLSDLAAREHIISRGVEHALDFSWDSTAERTAGFYRVLAG